VRGLESSGIWNSLCLSTSIFLSFLMSREFLEWESKPWLPMGFFRRLWWYIGRSEWSKGRWVERSEGRLWVERYDLLLSSFLLLYTLLLFISFFLSSRFLICVMGRCGNVSQKSTNSVTHRLLIFFFSLFTHEDSGKKKKHCLWYLGIGGCARDRWLQVWNSVLFTYFLVFCTTKSWFLGKLGTIGIKRKEIEDFWFSSNLSFCMKVWYFTRMGQNILGYM